MDQCEDIQHEASLSWIMSNRSRGSKSSMPLNFPRGASCDPRSKFKRFVAHLNLRTAVSAELYVSWLLSQRDLFNSPGFLNPGFWNKTHSNPEGVYSSQCVASQLFLRVLMNPFRVLFIRSLVPRVQEP